MILNFIFKEKIRLFIALNANIRKKSFGENNNDDDVYNRFNSK